MRRGCISVATGAVVVVLVGSFESRADPAPGPGATIFAPRDFPLPIARCAKPPRCSWRRREVAVCMASMVIPPRHHRCCIRWKCSSGPF
jgi:hypothetical protein